MVFKQQLFRFLEQTYTIYLFLQTLDLLVDTWLLIDIVLGFILIPNRKLILLR